MLNPLYAVTPKSRVFQGTADYPATGAAVWMTPYKVASYYYPFTPSTPTLSSSYLQIVNLYD